MSSATNSPSGQTAKRLNLKLILFVTLSVVGFIFYAIFDKQVFPAASIDVKMSKEQAFDKSKDIAKSFGYDVEHSLHSTTFITDDDAKTVLEFKLGVDKANQLMKSDVPVWIWRTRFCKELSKDEIYVAYTTHGDFKSVIHLFENDKKLPNVSDERALALAKEFVEKTGHKDLSAYELFDSGTDKKPHRLDHYFVWRKPGFSESEFKIKVEVAGDQVSTYKFWLDPTQTWTRQYTSIRQSNELLGKIASFLLFLFIATTIGAFIYGVTQHNIRWKFTLVSSGILALLVLLDALNNFSYSFVDSYETSSRFVTFVASTVMMGLLGTFAAFVMSVLLTGGAELVYRMTRPQEMAMQNLLSVNGMAQRDYANKTIMGYLIVGLMMFWAIGYYKFGQSIGYFCPLGVDDYKVLGNFCPAISGALTGVSAAGLEEFTCRVVALGLIQRWTKSFWLANILQAVIWGFAHSQYPQEPCYARGIELTVVGLFFGLIIRNYGILPCFVAHYLYDAFLTVEPVFASHNPVLIAPAIFVLLPFAVAVFYSKRATKAKNVSVETLDLTNGGQDPHVAPVHDEIEHGFDTPLNYQKMSGKRRLTLVAVAILGLAFVALPDKNELGKQKEVTVSATKATKMAIAQAKEDGLSVDGYQSVAQLLTMPATSDQQTWQFIYEQLGFAKTLDLYNATRPGLEWQVRFFKQLDPRSINAYLNADGTRRLIAIDDIKDSAGAKLEEQAALEIVKSYVAKYRTEFLPMELDTKSRAAEAKRVDYKFDFSVPKFAVKDTPALLHTEVKGDRISDLKIDWNVPDDWKWPHKKQRWYQDADNYLRLGGIAIFFAVSLWWGVHVLRSTRTPWRHSLVIGSICAVVLALSKLNTAEQLLFSYNTAETFDSFIGQEIAQQSLGLLLQTIGSLLLAVIGLTVLKYSFPKAMQQLKGWVLLKPNPAQRTGRMALWIDAAIGAYAFLGFSVAFKTLLGLTMTKFSPQIQIDVPQTLANIYCSHSPFFDLLATVLTMVIILPLFFALILSMWNRFIKSPRLAVVVILALSIVGGGTSWYFEECLIAMIFGLIQYTAYFFFVKNIFGSNVLSYIFVAMFATAVPNLGSFITHASKIGLAEIILLSVMLSLPALCALLVWFVDGKKVQQS